MVLTFKRPWMIEVRREHAPRVFAWALLAAIVLGLAYNYFGNPMPGPYGACYTGRGGTKPCQPPDAKPIDPTTLPVAKAP